jgi:hypothetical protein
VIGRSRLRPSRAREGADVAVVAGIADIRVADIKTVMK